MAETHPEAPRAAERTREIGMLRAVGMTRRQIRRMARWESILISLIRAALGIPLGVLLATLIGHTISFFRFAFPTGTIVVFVVAALIVGLLAAIFPARRASRPTCWMRSSTSDTAVLS